MDDPALLTHEDAIRYFLDTVGPALGAAGAVEQAVQRFVDFYATTRIVGADLEYDTDDFCLEAGAYPKLGLPGPGDYRGRGSEGGRVDDRLFIQVNLRRTVHPIGVLETHSQIDEEAFEMNAVLYFEPTDEKRPSVFVERQDPGNLRRELTAAMDRPLLRTLAGRAVDSVVYFVGGAG